MTDMATSVQAFAMGHEVRIYIRGVDAALSFSPDMAIALAKEIVKQAGIARFNIDREIEEFLNGEEL